MPLDTRAGFPTHWAVLSDTADRQVLAIHCTLAHAGSWKGLSRQMADDVAITAYDLPGHGRSADWDRRGDVQEVSMQMAIDLIEDQVDAPVDLFGHSFGGTVALRLAVERPDLVRSLVLVEPVFFAVAYADDPSIKARHLAGLAPYTAAIEAGDQMEAARVFTTTWGDGSGWDNIPPEVQQDMAKRVWLVHECAPMLNDDSAGLLAPGVLDRVTCPVLLMEGADSPEFIAAINAGLARRLPNASRAVIEGAGHMLPITHPAQTAEAIRGFLA